ncbi:MAG: hypothetical protein HKM98_02425 [Gammaproteobacteria bacterium]|nr:hypothetical protein [Gammaproteobacteria bacterium]
MPDLFFIFLAAVMVIAAVVITVLPLAKRDDPSPIVAGAFVALLPLATVLLYFTYSNWNWQTAPGDRVLNQQTQTTQPAQATGQPSVEEMVSRLEQRLISSPNDAEGWQMLGRSYVVLSRYPDALEAYARARELSSDTDVHAITGYAEALAMLRDGVIDTEVGELFEKALLVAPEDRKALWFGALAAFDRGQVDLARQRWQTLLDQNPPEEMAAFLREQMAATGGVSAGPASEEQIMPTPTTPVAGVSLRVSLAPELLSRSRPDAPLFILAREINAPGPPLAVVRRSVSDLPLQISLGDDNAMVPGRVLSAHDQVEVVARIALGGTPTAQSGDLSGSKIVSSNGAADIVIDQVVAN